MSRSGGSTTGIKRPASTITTGAASSKKTHTPNRPAPRISVSSSPTGGVPLCKPPIDRGPADAEESSYRGDVVLASGVHALSETQLLGGPDRWATAGTTPCPRGDQPCLGPLP